MTNNSLGLLSANKKRVLILGLAAAFLSQANPWTGYQTALAAPIISSDDVALVKKAVKDLNIEVSITSVAGIHGSRDGLDVSQQKLGISITNQDQLLLDLIQKNLGKKRGFDIKNGFVMQYRFSGTISPLLVGSQVEKDALKAVDAEVDAGAAEKREALYEMAPQFVEAELRSKVTSAVNASPMAALLTPDQKQQLISAQVTAKLPTVLTAGIPKVKQAIDSQVNAAVPSIRQEQREDHVFSRLDDLSLETGIQTVDATFALPINPFGKISEAPPGLFTFGFGKNHVALGADLKTNGLSKWENIIGHTNEGERGNTVASSGYASIGLAYSINKDLTLSVNFIGYHDRDPWMSAQQYIKQSLAVARDVFEKYQDVSALDSLGISAHVDAMITDNLNGQFWATITNRYNPNQGDKSNGYSFGGSIESLKSKTTLNFAYAYSGKAYFNQTYSIGVAQTIIEKETNSLKPGLILFTDFRGIKHLSSPIVHGSQETETQLIALGGKVDICKYVSPNLKLNCAIVGEYQNIVSSKIDNKSVPSSDDFYTGMMAEGNYNLF